MSEKTSILIVALISVFVRLPCLFGDFVFDDRPAIVNNNDVFNISQPWSKVFDHDFWGSNLTSKASHKSYRPLTTLTFRLNALFISESPLSFHAINIMIHCLNCILAFKLLRALKTSPEFALKASLYFAVHPVHTEAVCEVVGRADLLWAFFGLLALLVSVKAPKGHRSRILLIMALTYISVMCKEQGIMIVPMVFVLELITDKKCRTVKAMLTFGLIYGPFLACLIYLRLKIMNFEPPRFQEGDNPAAFIKNKFWRLVNFHYLYSLNAWIAVLPDWLCYDWAMGCIQLIKKASDLRLNAILLLWYIVAGLLIKRKKGLLLALAFTVLPFLPSANVLVTVGFVIGERNLYMSIFGLAILMAFAEGHIQKPKVTKPLFAMLLLILSLKSLHRGFEWQSEDALFKSGLKVCPKNAKVLYNLAKIDLNKAEGYYRQALRLWPNYEHAMNNLGNLLKNKGHYEEAEKWLLKATQKSPKFAAAFMNLGIVRTSLNKFEHALKSYKRALELRSDVYPDCHFNLGTLYLKMGLQGQAVMAFQKAIDQNELHFSAQSNLVILLDELGHYDVAEQAALKAIGLFSQRPDFYFHLANIYGKTKQYEKAEENFETVLKLEQNNDLYYLNFGVLYHRWKKFDKAKEMYEKCLAKNPQNQSALKNLESLDKAATELEHSKTTHIP